ncbi:hypothetical protein N0V82_005145 [Gnomoniopsis sp. IMI 355080]|nr:hypothetical protein N0V82_005145 [Gnomoniopsis sp. IMI 355080]
MSFVPSPSSIINQVNGSLGDYVSPGSLVESGFPAYVIALILFASAYSVIFHDSKSLTEKLYPVVNTNKEEYFTNGRALIQRGREKYGHKPFRYWQARIPGFEPYIALGSDLLHDVIKLNLTQKAMSKMTEPLSEETAAALTTHLTDNEEWHEIDLNMILLRITSQVSSRIFLGPELCSNSKWLDITVQYTAKATGAARVLRQYPYVLHRLVHWFLSDCRDVRRMVQEARETIAPILKSRRAASQAANSPQFSDTLQWYEDLARKRGVEYDAATQQIGLSIGAILTSTDLISQTMIDLCNHPENFEPLKTEIKQIVGDESGFKGNTMLNLKLMDSAMKETLRLKPVAVVALGRLVQEDVTLSDGTLLPKGSGVATSSERMWDPQEYPEPQKYDIYRYLRRREMAKDSRDEAVAQLVGTSEDHYGFGIGTHACPGRYFGVSTVKMVMTHLLMKYEFKLVEGTETEPLKFGFSQLANPRTKMMVRRKREVGW